MGGGFGVGNSFSFLRQTVRTNSAAPVADVALKPTSVYSLAEIEDRVRVIAHLSEPVPERYFADLSALEDFLRSENGGRHPGRAADAGGVGGRYR